MSTVGFDLHERFVGDADIVLVARVVGMSKRRRRQLGAAIAAALSVPLGISMYGDMNRVRAIDADNATMVPIFRAQRIRPTTKRKW